MPMDLRIVLPNRPGAALQVFGALAAEGINIEGVSGDIRPGERWGYIHILVEDGPRPNASSRAPASRSRTCATSTSSPSRIGRELWPRSFRTLPQRGSASMSSMEHLEIDSCLRPRSRIPIGRASRCRM